MNIKNSCIILISIGCSSIVSMELPKSNKPKSLHIVYHSLTLPHKVEKKIISECKITLHPYEQYLYNYRSNHLLSTNINALNSTTPGTVVPTQENRKMVTKTSVPLVKIMGHNNICLENGSTPHQTLCTLQEHIHADNIIFDGFNKNDYGVIIHNTYQNNIPVHRKYMIAKNNPFKLFNGNAHLSFEDTIAKQGHIPALSLHYKSNRFICACSIDADSTRLHVYDTSGQFLSLQKKYITLTSTIFLKERIKKICLLSKTLGLLLSRAGTMYSFFIDSNNTITCNKKNITDVAHNPIVIDNFAADPIHPYQVLLLSTAHHMYLINLKIKEENKPFVFSKIADNINATHLWFYNDTIGYLQKDKKQTIMHLNNILYK